MEGSRYKVFLSYKLFLVRIQIFLKIQRFKMKNFSKSLLIFLSLILFLGCEGSQKQQGKNSKVEINKRQNSTYEYFKATDEKIDDTFNKKGFYVPVYSHIYLSENNYTRLSISLSIRNTDSSDDLYVESINYYDTQGKLIKEYISQPHILKPMSSIDCVVNLEDMSGGNGAKFLVNVASKNKTYNPIIQAIMSNTQGNSSLSFLTEGHLIK